ncbi:MAG: asparaginase [Firmicutes bacterium]|nr:asparaginase [Bacillota bacterium]
MSEILVHVVRGEQVESRHHGDVVVVDRHGKIRQSLGDPHRFTYWRSAAKPFQVLPLVEAGGVEHFCLTPAEIAIMASSHSGEPQHIELVQGILNKIGCTVSDLQCGVTVPINSKTARELLRLGKTATSLHNPCSGKHTAMLALAQLKGYPIEGYLKPGHPVQQMMLATVAEVCAVNPAEIVLGIDGCGVPVFGLPISRMALAYARLAIPEEGFGDVRGRAARIILEAIRNEPFFVAGTGRLETVLMEVTRGRLVAKAGAEGVFNVALLSEGLGICVKIDDGNNRAVDPVVVKLLKQLDFLSERELSALENYFQPQLTNNRGERIGYLEAVFD